MIVAFIIDETWDSASVDYALKIANLARKKHIVYILCVKNSFTDKHSENVLYIKPLRNKNPVKSLIAFKVLHNRLKKINPDIVISIRGDASFFACLLKKTLNFKLFRIFRENKTLRTPPNCIDKLILPCEFLKNKIPPGRVKEIVILKSFIDSEKFKLSRQGRERIRKDFHIENSFVFGSVGRLDKVKGFDMLIKAFAKANIENSLLFIVGEEKSLKKTQLEKIAKDYNVADKIIILNQRRSDIVDIISAFDVGVISSISSEVIPRVLFEFIAVGLPIVSTNVGCLPEIVNESFGILSKPNVDKLSLAIKQISSKNLKNLSINALTNSKKYSLHLQDNLF